MRRSHKRLAPRRTQSFGRSARPSPSKTKRAPFPVESPEPALARRWQWTAERSRKTSKHPGPATMAPIEGICPTHPPVLDCRLYGAPDCRILLSQIMTTTSRRKRPEPALIQKNHTAAPIILLVPHELRRPAEHETTGVVIASASEAISSRSRLIRPRLPRRLRLLAMTKASFFLVPHRPRAAADPHRMKRS